MQLFFHYANTLHDHCAYIEKVQEKFVQLLDNILPDIYFDGEM